MKSLYVTSIENFSGKTAVTLGLGRRFQVEGHQIGYYKPVSYETAAHSGGLMDEDVTFVRNVLSLHTDPHDLFGVLVTPETLDACLRDAEGCKFDDKIIAGSQRAGEGKDLLLIEGGGSLRQGYAIGLSTPYVAELIGAPVLVVIRFQSELSALDDALTAQFRLKDRLLGVVFNRVPEDEMGFATTRAREYLEKNGIPVLGALPERPNLAALTVAEIAQAVEGTFVGSEEGRDDLVKELVVGAMGAQEALSRFRSLPDKAVITGGDRADIQLAALETSTACLVLTGNLQPSLTVLERAQAQHIPILVTGYSTMGAIESIERIFGKTRLNQAQKLAFFEALLAEHLDYKRLHHLLGL